MKKATQNENENTIDFEPVIKIAMRLRDVWVANDSELVDLYISGFQKFVELTGLARTKPSTVNSYHKILKPVLVDKNAWSEGYARKRLCMLRAKAKLAKQPRPTPPAPNKSDKISLTINSETTTIKFDSEGFEADLYDALVKMLNSNKAEETLTAINLAIEHIG